MATMDTVQLDLYEFLTESELQHYYNSIKNELKITNASQFKYATDEDLKQIGLSRPEIRRLRKYYEKYFPHGYLSKIKRLLQTPTTIVKRDDGSLILSQSSLNAADSPSADRASNSPGKTPNNKHIIPADSIFVNKQLGTGEFGVVQQGVWTNGSERIQVAIKCLCRERMQSNPMEFLKEAAIMHSIEHENIVRLYGVVLATDSLMLVTELAHLRSLLECLKDSGLRVSFLTIPTLCEFAMQICNGMKYLENKRLIHRDLAARNILVFNKNKVKISDFGLSRALGVGKDYYKTNFNVNLKLPIAWCASECINYLRFTNASDVWAYGVCLWEMFSYGFQPWAALTGLQILEAIDTPNFQRLEQPECCPRDYYQLMMKCWQDDPLKRPKFAEIYEMLPEIKPEQLKAVFNNSEPKKDHLLYRQGDIITVLDRNANTPLWKGALNSGKTGLFNPANTVAHLESLPSSSRDSFSRSSERCSKRKLRTEMISKPQNDLKHTGHIGIDGESFGDVAFLANSQSYNHLPRQIVTPYKPSEDIEQTPLLLPPTPTSPDSLQTASSYFPEGTTSSTNPTFVPSNENTPKKIGSSGRPSFDFPGEQLEANSFSACTNPFANNHSQIQNSNYELNAASPNTNNTNPETNSVADNTSISYISKRTTATWIPTSSGNNPDEHHEYHEISDDDINAEKFDFGPSLLDEINSMFGSMNASTSYPPKSPESEHTNKKNEFTELSNKLNQISNFGECSGNKTGTSKKRGACTVKPISVKDEKILNHAIEIANEISARSMTDLVCEQAPSTQSPKRKFSFRFPHLTHQNSTDKPGACGGSGSSGLGQTNVNNGISGNPSYNKEKKNFTEELKNIPDLQTLIGEEGREAYNSLIERKSGIIGAPILSLANSFLSHLDTNEFELAAAKTFPRRSIHIRCDKELNRTTSGDNTVCESPDISIPQQNAPRPMTLPNRGAASRLHKSGELKLIKGNISPEGDLKSNEEFGGPTNISSSSIDSPCESPSYVTNTALHYTFPDHANSTTLPSEEFHDPNPLPLPSREGKKHIRSNPKRHVRKYPLIIPAYGVQRTLNKVTEVTPTEDDEPKALALSNETGRALKTQHLRQCELKLQSNTNLRRFTHEVVAAVRPTTRNSTPYENTLSNSTHDSTQQRIYQNIQASNTDSASLQFESILENDIDKINVLPSPDVSECFYNFSIQIGDTKCKNTKDITPELSDLHNNSHELGMEKVVVPPMSQENSADGNSLVDGGAQRNLSENAATITKAAIPAVCKSPSKNQINELAAHALFKKVRESVDLAMGPVQSEDTVDIEHSVISNVNEINSDVVDAAIRISEAQSTKKPQSDGEYFSSAVARLKDSNSVSCEDLLEFSDKKPKGCERGVDSDEVRIMMKVLGKEANPTRCLDVLEYIDWDVHKAIKLIKLQNIVGTLKLTLAESIEALQKNEWDLQTTAIKIKGLK